MTSAIAVESKLDNKESKTSGAREAKTTSDLELSTESATTPDRASIRKGIADAVPLFDTKVEHTKGDGFLKSFAGGFLHKTRDKGSSNEVDGNNVGAKLNVYENGRPQIQKQTSATGVEEAVLRIPSKLDDIVSVHLVDLEERRHLSTFETMKKKASEQLVVNLGDATHLPKDATFVLEKVDGSRLHIPLSQIQLERAPKEI